ncbi:MAG: ABC transporter, substrate-binding protein (cluster 2, ribose/xylose/arabinose/galactose) [uncultured Caballeronia sp.]|nr:MAG: ABC transporter, substrate-binding protein (cluster 2, ribose/xylose/arabinose/galactose) [uncultured Caballeronia sp.]
MRLADDDDRREQLGIETSRQYPEPDRTARRPDIVFPPREEKPLAPIVLQAKKAGIPVILPGGP